MKLGVSGLPIFHAKYEPVSWGQKKSTGPATTASAPAP
jgi:hypothetical protein